MTGQSDEQRQRGLLEELEALRKLLEADPEEAIPILSDVVTTGDMPPVPHPEQGDPEPLDEATEPYDIDRIFDDPGDPGEDNYGPHYPSFSLDVRIAEEEAPDRMDRPEAAPGASAESAQALRARLIDAVIDSLMPELRATLRQQLSACTDAQLRELARPRPPEEDWRSGG